MGILDKKMIFSGVAAVFIHVAAFLCCNGSLERSSTPLPLPSSVLYVSFLPPEGEALQLTGELTAEKNLTILPEEFLDTESPSSSDRVIMGQNPPEIEDLESLLSVENKPEQISLLPDQDSKETSMSSEAQNTVLPEGERVLDNSSDITDKEIARESRILSSDFFSSSSILSTPFSDRDSLSLSSFFGREGLSSGEEIPLEAVRVEPSPMNDFDPAYPFSARMRGLEGIVVIEVSVSSNGMVNSAIIAASSGEDVLDQAALDSVRKMSFIAGTVNNTPTEMTVKVRIVFSLEVFAKLPFCKIPTTMFKT